MKKKLTEAAKGIERIIGKGASIIMTNIYLMKKDFAEGRVMNKRGMEMVQVAILIALAVALGIIFRTEITKFINNTFKTLNS